MSINKIIIGAMKEFDIPCVPDLYTGSEKKYITFNPADDHGSDFGDNIASCNIVSMQIHLFLPDSENYLMLKKNIRKALIDAGFTHPIITVLTEPDKHIRHIVFECEIEEVD